MKFFSKIFKKEPKFVTLPYGDKYDKLDFEIIIGGVVDRKGKEDGKKTLHDLVALLQRYQNLQVPVLESIHQTEKGQSDRHRHVALLPFST